MNSRIWASLAAASIVATPAVAREFTFIYTGAFGAEDQLTPGGGGADLIDGLTPFQLTADFDDTSFDLTSVLPGPLGTGWVAYRPTRATFRIDAVEYAIDPSVDFAIALFDRTNIFFPGLYGAGWIVDADLSPAQGGDGPGNIGDYRGASPEFSSDDLMQTVFTGFQGAGFSSGTGCPSACTLEPLALVGPGGVGYLLQLSPREDQANEGDPIQQAVLLPEPGARLADSRPTLIALKIVDLATPASVAASLRPSMRCAPVSPHSRGRCGSFRRNVSEALRATRARER